MTSFKAPISFSSTSQETIVQRSSHFIGHLNKNWVMQNLPRYMLALSSWKNKIKTNDFQILPEESIDSSIASVNRRKSSFLSLESKKALCTSNQTFHKNWKYTQDPLEFQNHFHRSSILNSLTLEKIVLHSTSGKLYQSPKSSCILDLTFSTLSCQTPTKVYSRKAIAAFKLSKYTLLGVKTTLRNTLKHEFFYKFYFLQAAENSSFTSKSQSQSKSSSLFPNVFEAFKSLASQNSLKHQSSKLSSKSRNSLFDSNLPMDQAERFKGKFKAISFQKSNQNPVDKPKLLQNSKAFVKKGLNHQLSVYNFSSKIKKNHEKVFSTSAIAIKNVFIFNELDSLDYDLFSNLAGFEVMLVSRKLV
uniref:Ribosomal protein L5 n=1 Tax=Gloeotilopsis planctonica TaxID=34157 RepID=A0A1B2RYZ5_9CHLO|nr:ribosomal protein L5 [Gloeotilopsis planctonica]